MPAIVRAVPVNGRLVFAYADLSRLPLLPVCEDENPVAAALALEELRKLLDGETTK